MPQQKVASADRVVPRLEGWLTPVEAADSLGISRQAVTRFLGLGYFRSQHAVGERPLYVIRVEEVVAFADAHAEFGDWGKAAQVVAGLSDRKVGLKR